MKLLLTAISGSREGKSFAIEPHQSMTFGRTNASTWSFEDDGHMSSIHFEVENLGSHGEVRDRGSTNGTWLNNHKISREQLREGDRIRAGKTILTVEFVQSQVEESPLHFDSPIADVPPIRNAPTPPPSRPTPQIPSPQQIQPPQNPGPKTTPVSAPAPNPPASHPSAAAGFGPPPQLVSNFSESFSDSHLPSGDDARKNLARDSSPPMDHSSKRATSPARPINPFDSIDFSAPSPAGEPQPAPISFQQQFESSAGSENRADSPISDSSFSFRIPAQPSMEPREFPARSSASHQLLERQTTLESAEAFAIILGALSQRWSIQLVLHFQKIRATPPMDCNIQPLFKWLSLEDAINYAPVRINWSDVQANPSLLGLLPRLCRADACLAFLGKSTIETGLQVEEMLRLGVIGFSEAEGFLPICWPSSFSTIVDVSGPCIAEKLFARRISGALLCSPWNRNKIAAIVDPEIANDLRDNSFIDTPRIIG